MNEATRFILYNKKCGIFLRMGAGKTKITLDALRRLPAGRTLVIAPKIVAETVWQEEAEKYDFPEIPTAVKGSPERRLRLLRSDSNFFTISVDLIPWLVEEQMFRFRYVIIDESSKFKDASTNRFKALKKVIQEAERVILLSGTPVSRGIEDIWSQMYLLDGGERLGKSFYQFRNLYFRKVGDNKWLWVPYKWAPHHILKLVEDICYNEETASEGIPPEKHYRAYIYLSEASRKAYTQMEKTLVLAMKDGTVIEAGTRDVMINKLLQISSGAIYNSEGEIKSVHHGKLKKLKELIRTLKKQWKNVIVIYNYRFERDLLLREIPGSRLLSRENILLWNHRQLPCLLLNPKSAGHGLNLQFGGSVVIWYGLTWSLEEYLQVNARVTRRGQKAMHTEIYHIIAKETIEEILMRKLGRREEFQESFLTAVRKPGFRMEDIQEEIRRKYA